MTRLRGAASPTSVASRSQARHTREVVKLSLEALREGLDADVGSFLEDVDGQLVVTQAFGWEAVGAVALEGTPAYTAFETCVTSIGAVELRNPDSLMARLGLRSTIAVPVVLEDGPCGGVLTVHVKRVEGFSEDDVSLVEQTAHLVATVAGREQLERRLRTAQRLEAVGQLAAGIAHDFNNLLQAISGYTELALRHADEPGARYLEQVAHAASRADELTSQLLAYSRKQDLRAVGRPRLRRRHVVAADGAAAPRRRHLCRDLRRGRDRARGRSATRERADQPCRRTRATRCPKAARCASRPRQRVSTRRSPASTR